MPLIDPSSQPPLIPHQTALYRIDVLDTSSTTMTTTTINIDAHTQAVEALKTKEAALRYDHDALSNMTSDEAQANTILTRLRDAEVQSHWEKEGDLDNAAGMEFYGARRNGMGPFEPTLKVWDAVQKMPKGALLHCHFDGTVDTRFLLAKARETPNMAMKSDMPLSNKEALYKARSNLLLPEAEERSQTSIYSDAYVPGEWVSFKTARETYPYPHPYLSEEYKTESDLPVYFFPLTNGASATTSDLKALAFDAYIHTLMTMTPHPGARPIINSKQAWAKFQSTFGVIAGLLGYEPTLKAYTKELLLSHTRDGISYTEARINFLTEFMVRSDGTNNLTHTEWVQIFIEAVNEVKAELANEGTIVDAKIIYTTVRFIDNEKLRWYLEDCIMLKKKFPTGSWASIS